MAIHIPSEAYSGGAVKFNSQPTVNLYGQVLAHQQAKRDAMDQYERSRLNSVNEVGLRDQDRKRLDDKLADLRSHYNLNKDKIQKGNSQEAFDYEKKFRDVRDLIADSKDRAARHDAGFKFYHDRLEKDQRMPDDFMKELHDNDMPIGETYVDSNGVKQEYKPFDMAKWASQPKPFTQQSYLTGFKDLKRTPGLPVYEKTDNPLKLNEVTEEKFDTGAKQVIAARAADKYDNSYSFSSQIKNEIQDPVRRKQLSDLFTQEYGVQPTSPSDYAIAYTMEMLQPSVKKVKSIDDKAAIASMNDKLIRSRMALQSYYTGQHIDQRTKQILADIGASDTNFDQIWNTVKEKLPSGLVHKVYTIPSDEKGHKLEDPIVTLSPDGQTYNFDYKDDKGNIIPQYHAERSAASVKTQYKQDLHSAIQTKTTIPAKMPQQKNGITPAEKMRAAATKK